MSRRLAVITCHFNFKGYVTPQANLMRFMRHMASLGIPVYGVEAILPGQKPFTTPLQHWKRVELGERGVLWQKEALLNLAERMVPEQYDQICWVDADVTFTNAQWAAELSQALQGKKVVQPFERAHWTHRNGSWQSSRPSMFRAGFERAWAGHQGFALGFQRSFWNKCQGFYDLAPVGNGDTALAAALMHQDPVAWLSTIVGCNGIGDTPASMAKYRLWAEKVKAWSKDSMGFIAGDVWHEWHGEPVRRYYHERCEWMKGLDTKKEIRKTPTGVLEWTEKANPDRVEKTRHYFTARKEDG